MPISCNTENYPMTTSATPEMAERRRSQPHPNDWARNVLDSLDEQSRHILRQYYSNGQSVEQISVEMKIPTLKISAVIGEAKRLTALALNSKVTSRVIGQHGALGEILPAAAKQL
jgi:hypothetical protein